MKKLTIFILLYSFYFLFSSVVFAAFTGPGTCVPPACGGKFSVDSQGNIGFGTNNSSATPVSTFNSTGTESGSSNFGYIFMVASTTNPGIGIKNTTANATYLLSVRDFGNLQLYRETMPGFHTGGALGGLVMIDINAFGDIAIGGRATSTGSGIPARLYVDNAIKAGGGFSGSGVNLTAISADKVTAGAFQSSNYAFPASLAVGTTTLVFPQTLSVYGGGYFRDNVGIGTTTPRSLLMIYGLSSNNESFLSIKNASATDPVAGSNSWQMQIVPQLGNNGYNKMSNSNDVGLIFRGADGPDSGILNIIPHSNGAASGIKISSSVVAIATKSPANGVIFNVSSTVFNITGSGNVGIGTTTPQFLLHLSYSSVGNPIFIADAYGNNSNMRLRRANGTPTAPTAVVLNNILGIWGTTGYDGSAFRTGNSASMRITASENWNTTSTGSLMTFFTTNNGTTTQTEKMRLGNNGALGLRTQITTNGMFTISQLADVATSGIRIENNGGTRAMHLWVDGSDNSRIDSGSDGSGILSLNGTGGGNVGIATTTPIYKLDVVGTARFSQPVIVAEPTATNHAATKSYVDSVSTGGTGVWLLSGSNLYTSSTSWNVGIGTTTAPTAKLHIFGGDIRIGTNNKSLYGTHSDGISSILMATINASNQVLFGSDTDLDTILSAWSDAVRIRLGDGQINYGSATHIWNNFGDFTGEKMRLNSNGNLGIGTTNPVGLLQASSSAFIVTYAGNVGIGTTTPTRKLDIVVGALNGDGIRLTTFGNGDGLSNSTGLVFASGTVSQAVLGLAMNNSDYSSQSLAADFVLRATTGRLFLQTGINVAGMVINGNNVGIGTTTPSYLLDVVGTAQFSQPVIVGTPTTNSHAATKNYVDSTITGGTSGLWLLSGSNLYTSSTSWNVGIGTTTPGAKLQVQDSLTGAYSATAAPTSNISRIWNINNEATNNKHATLHFRVSSNNGTQNPQGYITLLQPTAGSNLADFAFTLRNASGHTEKMRITSDGNVGIGTTTPQSLLHLSGTVAPAQFIDIYGNNSNIRLRRANGTAAAPTAVVNNDAIGVWGVTGYNGAAFPTLANATMIMAASENWNTTSTGTFIYFQTTNNGATAQTEKMRLGNNGALGLGTTGITNGMFTISQLADVATSGIRIENNGGTRAMHLWVDGSDNSRIDSGSDGSGLLSLNGTGGGNVGIGTTTPQRIVEINKAVSTSDGPFIRFSTPDSAITTNTLLGGLEWYADDNSADETNEPVGYLQIIGTEVWNGSNSGSLMQFGLRASADVSPTTLMVINEDGNVGIGTTTPARALQVFGDIRIGTSGANGCLEQFNGTLLSGSCVSDKRLKKNIVPLTGVLDKITNLQPIYYEWNANAEKLGYSGKTKNIGLLAQDVEKVFPNLVSQNDKGYKQVNYGLELQMLTLEAVRELKIENEKLKVRIDNLELKK